MEQQQAHASSKMAQPPTITLDMLTRLLDFSPDASLVVDAAGTIVLLNAQVASLFGYAQGELLGQPLEVVVLMVVRAALLMVVLPDR